jgi:hypothetical protein
MAFQSRCSINANLVIENLKQVQINTLQAVYISGNKYIASNSKFVTIWKVAIIIRAIIRSKQHS